MNKPAFRQKHLGKVFTIMCTILLLAGGGCTPTGREQSTTLSVGSDETEIAINAYVSDPQYEDDPFILIAVKEAIAGRKTRNGGIGACLINEESGVVVECGHNEQYVPHFRSDLHAEMVLLNRYEDRMRIIRSFGGPNNTVSNPRIHMEKIVLYTSVEPCPMCMARIINSGVKKFFMPQQITAEGWVTG